MHILYTFTVEEAELIKFIGVSYSPTRYAILEKFSEKIFPVLAELHTLGVIKVDFYSINFELSPDLTFLKLLETGSDFQVSLSVSGRNLKRHLETEATTNVWLRTEAEEKVRGYVKEMGLDYSGSRYREVK
jgi:hypothetical protein